MCKRDSWTDNLPTISRKKIHKNIPEEKNRSTYSRLGSANNTDVKQNNEL